MPSKMLLLSLALLQSSLEPKQREWQMPCLLQALLKSSLEQSPSGPQRSLNRSGLVLLFLEARVSKTMKIKGRGGERSAVLELEFPSQKLYVSLTVSLATITQTNYIFAIIIIRMIPLYCFHHTVISRWYSLNRTKNFR